MDGSHTMHIGRIVFFRRELVRSQRVNKLPDGTVSSAIGVAIAVGHRTRAVRVNSSRTINIVWNNPFTANIGNGVHLRTFHIHQTGSRTFPISRNRQLRRQHDVERERPRLLMSSTVGIFIVEHQITLTAVVLRAVDDDGVRSKRIFAGILHHRHRDIRHIGLGQTIHGLLREFRIYRDTIRTVDREMLGNLGGIATDILHRVGSGHVNRARGINHILTCKDKIRLGDTVVANRQTRNRVHHGMDIHVCRRNHRTATSRQRLVGQRARNDRIHRIINVIGVSPSLGMSRHTIFVSIDINHRILTAVGRGILDGKRRDDDVLATIGHRRRNRTFHIRCTHHQRVSIGRHLERLGFHTISVTPSVMLVVDRVVIDEGTVTTSARQVTRICARSKRDVRTAIGTLR